MNAHPENPQRPDDDASAAPLATPTRYGDTTFRSALEAGWANSLDVLRVRWRYEPETITLPSGTVYLPDFWLPELGIWIEVKGDGVPRIEKAIELGETRACRCVADCTCTWPGGELVLIGHPSERYTAHRDDRFPGASTGALTRWAANAGFPRSLSWSAAFGRNALFGKCGSCRRPGWSNTGRCRACGGRFTGQAHFSGAPALSFITAGCKPAPANGEGADR